jgi:hypothetical protein
MQQQLAMDMETTAASYNCWIWSLFAAFFFILIITLASSASSEGSWYNPYYHYDYYYHGHDHHPLDEMHPTPKPTRSSSFMYYPYGWTPGDAHAAPYIETVAFVLVCISLLALIGCVVYLATCRGYASEDEWGSYSSSSPAVRRQRQQQQQGTDDSGTCSSMCPCLASLSVCMSSYLCCCCSSCSSSSQLQGGDDYAVQVQAPQYARASDPFVAVFVRDATEVQDRGRPPPYAPWGM